MTKTRFNQIVSRARRFGEVIYDDHGGHLIFRANKTDYGFEYSLAVVSGHERNNVDVGWDLKRFRDIMVD